MDGEVSPLKKDFARGGIPRENGIFLSHKTKIKNLASSRTRASKRVLTPYDQDTTTNHSTSSQPASESKNQTCNSISQTISPPIFPPYHSILHPTSSLLYSIKYILYQRASTPNQRSALCPLPAYKSPRPRHHLHRHHHIYRFIISLLSEIYGVNFRMLSHPKIGLRSFQNKLHSPLYYSENYCYTVYRIVHDFINFSQRNTSYITPRALKSTLMPAFMSRCRGL